MGETALRASERRTDGSPKSGCGANAGDPELSAAGAAARQLYIQRRLRNQVFGPDAAVFAEPCWDMLLDLFVAAEAGRRISVMSSCIAADVPTTTAQRHVQRLERRGLVVRERDETDARRAWLSLTPRADTMLRRFLDAEAARLTGKTDAVPAVRPTARNGAR